MKNSRAFKTNMKNQITIALNKWNKNKNIIYIYNNYNYNNSFEIKKDIIKGVYLFNNIYSFSFNKRIVDMMNNLLIYYSNNENKKLFFLKLNILFDIIQKHIINNIKKNTFRLFLEIFKLSEEEKILKNELSYIIFVIQNAIVKINLKYKAYFFQKLINYYNKIKYLNDFNIYYNNSIKNIKSLKYIKYQIQNNRMIALKKISKYLINNSVKNNFANSLKNIFYRWSSLIGYCPKIIMQSNNNIIDSEDEEDLITQRKEINELQKCLKEDQDFQHDLKAKINALEEENNFICEKIFDITQRVEKCEKCSNLLKSSYISDNNCRSSNGSMMKNVNDKIKSRNIVQGAAATSSGLNVGSAGTELVPRKPQGTINMYEEASDPCSDQMDDIEENHFENINTSKPYLIGIKQKIIDLKKEKEPIINKLKEEIKSIYLELNMI
jgi:hypothetical protein